MKTEEEKRLHDGLMDEAIKCAVIHLGESSYYKCTGDGENRSSSEGEWVGEMVETYEVSYLYIFKCLNLCCVSWIGRVATGWAVAIDRAADDVEMIQDWARFIALEEMLTRESAAEGCGSGRLPTGSNVSYATLWDVSNISVLEYVRTAGLCWIIGFLPLFIFCLLALNWYSSLKYLYKYVCFGVKSILFIKQSEMTLGENQVTSRYKTLYTCFKYNSNILLWITIIYQCTNIQHMYAFLNTLS
jgi:hypothetical protein